MVSQGFINGLGGTGGTSKDYAGNAVIGGQGGANGGTVAWQKVQYVAGNASLVSQLNGAVGHQTGLLCRLGDNSITGSQSGGYLAGKDGQREVPGADADKHPTALQQQFVELTGRAGQYFCAVEHFAGLLRVVTAKIHGLTHFIDTVLQDTTGFTGNQGNQLGTVGFKQVGKGFQRSRAFFDIAVTPGREGLQCQAHGVIDGVAVSKVDLADNVLVVLR